MIGALGGLLALRLPLLGEIDLWLLRHIGILRLLVKVHLPITSHTDESGLSFVLLSYPLAQGIARSPKPTFKLSLNLRAGLSFGFHREHVRNREIMLGLAPLTACSLVMAFWRAPVHHPKILCRVLFC